MPPDHGAAAVRLVLEDDGADRAVARRARHRCARACARSAPRSARPGTAGALDLAPLGAQTRAVLDARRSARSRSSALRDEHGVYMAGSGRINVAGLTMGNMPKFIAALADVTARSKPDGPPAGPRRGAAAAEAAAPKPIGTRSTRSPPTASCGRVHPVARPLAGAGVPRVLRRRAGAGRRAGDHRQGERRGDRLVALPGLRSGGGGAVEIGWSFLARALLGRRLQRRVQAADARARVPRSSTAWCSASARTTSSRARRWPTSAAA